jgi:hypothetical protein
VRYSRALFTALVLAEIGYPLVDGPTRARLTVATGFPFGSYAYSPALGPRLLGVPVVIPLAWTWMAWPAWLVAGRLVTGVFRVPLAGLTLAAWDLFLDPQWSPRGTGPGTTADRPVAVLLPLRDEATRAEPCLRALRVDTRDLPHAHVVAGPGRRPRQVAVGVVRLARRSGGRRGDAGRAVRAAVRAPAGRLTGGADRLSVRRRRPGGHGPCHRRAVVPRRAGHPASIAAFAVLVAISFRRRRQGRLAWKGRPVEPSSPPSGSGSSR